MAKVIRSGVDVVQVDGEPGAGPAETAHHLVGDVDDAVLVAQFSNAGQVAGRRRHDAGRARNGLQDDGGDRARALELDDLTQVLQRALALLGLGAGVERRAVEERAEEVHGAGRAQVVGPAPGVAGGVDRGVGTAVVAAIGRQHLVAAGVLAGHPDRVLDRLGPAVGEEDLAHVVRCPLDDQPGRFAPGRVGVLRGNRGQELGLLLDRRHDLRMLVPDVDVDQLTGQVQQPVAVAVGHIAALGLGDDHRFQRLLGTPGVEDVAAVIAVGAGRILGQFGQRQVGGEGGIVRHGYRLLFVLFGR